MKVITFALYITVLFNNINIYTPHKSTELIADKYIKAALVTRDHAAHEFKLGRQRISELAQQKQDVAQKEESTRAEILLLNQCYDQLLAQCHARSDEAKKRLAVAKYILRRTDSICIKTLSASCEALKLTSMQQLEAERHSIAQAVTAHCNKNGTQVAINSRFTPMQEMDVTTDCAIDDKDKSDSQLECIQTKCIPANLARYTEYCTSSSGDEEFVQLWNRICAYEEKYFSIDREIESYKTSQTAMFIKMHGQKTSDATDRHNLEIAKLSEHFNLEVSKYNKRLDRLKLFIVQCNGSSERLKNQLAECQDRSICVRTCKNALDIILAHPDPKLQTRISYIQESYQAPSSFSKLPLVTKNAVRHVGNKFGIANKVFDVIWAQATEIA
jgi:hypothetical protein